MWEPLLRLSDRIPSPSPSPDASAASDSEATRLQTGEQVDQLSADVRRDLAQLNDSILDLRDDMDRLSADIQVQEQY